MDPAHRDRIAFLRVCSGAYEPGMRMYHTRLGREVRVGDAITFMAADRQHVEEAYAGDIIGLHNHGTINIGDSFTQGEALTFTGIPSFAPELFRRALLRDPLKLKALHKGPCAALRGRRDAAVSSADRQRSDLGRRRSAAIRSCCVSFARRVQRRSRIRGRRCRGGALGALDGPRAARRVREEARRQRRARPHGATRLLGAEHREPGFDAGALAEDPVLHDARVERGGGLTRRGGAQGAKRRDFGRERRQRRAVGIGLVARAQIELDDSADSRSLRAASCPPLARRRRAALRSARAAALRGASIGARTMRSTTPPDRRPCAAVAPRQVQRSSRAAARPSSLRRARAARRSVARGASPRSRATRAAHAGARAHSR